MLALALVVHLASGQALITRGTPTTPISTATTSATSTPWSDTPHPVTQPTTLSSTSAATRQHPCRVDTGVTGTAPASTSSGSTRQIPTADLDDGNATPTTAAAAPTQPHFYGCQIEIATYVPIEPEECPSHDELWALNSGNCTTTLCGALCEGDGECYTENAVSISNGPPGPWSIQPALLNF